MIKEKTDKNGKKKIIKISIIILISILIILVVVFGFNIFNIDIINSNKKAANGNNSSTLIANNIKKGITIGGITGTLEDLDTSDATATPKDILKGKTAYVNGVKITGTYIQSTLGSVTGNENTNTEVNDSLGNKVTVPAGFKVVNPSDTVLDGIIIEDVSAGDSVSKGNQFVWIPVGKINTPDGIEEIKLARYDFYMKD